MLAPKKIKLEIKEVKIGAIQSDAIEEHGVILDIGSEVPKEYAIGKTLYYKAWAIDINTKDTEKRYYINYDSDAILEVE